MENLTKQEKEQNNPNIGIVPFQKEVKGTGFSERLKEVIGNKSGRAFAKEVNISYSTLHNYLTNVSSPTLDNLISLANATGVSLEWLATGEGTKKNSNIVERAFERLEKERSEPDEISMLESFESIDVSAGLGSFNEGVTEPDGQVPYDNNLLHSLGVKATNCGVFWANGYSMQPTIFDGDQLLVDFSKKEIRNGKIYLIQNNDSIWVKRVKLLWEGIELISDNQDEYAPIIISKEDAEHLKIIGQVVHVGHRLI